MNTTSPRVAVGISDRAPGRPRTGWRYLRVTLWRNRYLYAMLVPPFVFFGVFRLYPMLGSVLAFKNYQQDLGIWGSPWVGTRQFELLFSDELFMRSLWNTISIASLKLIFVFPASIILALFINELVHINFKRVVQTIVYAPYFLSWVIYAAILYVVLSPVNGMVNNILADLGFEKIPFFQRPELFQPLVILSSILKEAGWGAVIYLAAISAIDPQLYEAGHIDGANRWQLMRHVTLPGLSGTIVTLLILQLGWFLSVGFAQVFIMQNNIVLPTGDIIETFIYRVGILRGRFDFTAAAGLFNSAVGMVLVLAADRFAKRLGQRGIF